GLDGGLRHDGKLGVFRVQSNGDAASLPDSLNSEGPVLVGAAEDDGNGARSVETGDGLEEQIDRGAGEVHELRMHQLDGPRADEEVLVGWTNVNIAREDELAVFGLLHSAMGAGGQDRGEMTFASRTEVLNDDDGGRRDREVRQNVAESVKPTGRGTKSDYVILPVEEYGGRRFGSFGHRL